MKMNCFKNVAALRLLLLHLYWSAVPKRREIVILQVLTNAGVLNRSAAVSKAALAAAVLH